MTKFIKTYRGYACNLSYKVPPGSSDVDERRLATAARGKIGAYEDPNIQRAELSRLKNTNNGLLFDEVEATAILRRYDTPRTEVPDA